MIAKGYDWRFSDRCRRGLYSVTNGERAGLPNQARSASSCRLRRAGGSMRFARCSPSSCRRVAIGTPAVRGREPAPARRNTGADAGIAHSRRRRPTRSADTPTAKRSAGVIYRHACRSTRKDFIPVHATGRHPRPCCAAQTQPTMCTGERTGRSRSRSSKASRKES